MDDGGSNNFCMFPFCVIGHFRVCTFVKLFVSESHAFRVSRINIIVVFMTFQHFAICVDFHLLQAVCCERGKTCLSTIKRVCTTKIDVDSLFARQTTLHLWFGCFHLSESILKFVIICNTASFATVLPRTVVPHTSVLHESDDVCIHVTKGPTD